MNRDGILFQYSLATEGGMNSCGASPREEQDNRLCVGCYYILDHSLSGLFILHKGGHVMRNYWYVSLSNRYPQPNTDDPVRVVQSVQIKKKYSIIEMAREATPKEIDKCKLLYCGHGFYSDKHIQENLSKYV